MKKTILITGAATGIGRDTAIALAERGHKVFATTYLKEEVGKLNKYAQDRNLHLEVFKLDITNAKDRKKISNLKLDVLINNAAIGESGSLIEIPIDRVRKNFETNLFATLELTQLALKKMIKNNSGRVIFISSLLGRMVMPFWGPYCLTKYSLSAAAEVMKREVKYINKAVHICVVEPGAYYTGSNQKIMDTKFTWMDKNSYFFNILKKIKQREERVSTFLELKNTKSIVKKIVEVVESKNPRFRYSAPWWMAVCVQILRIFGK